jgi:hypothetical protein
MIAQLCVSFLQSPCTFMWHIIQTVGLSTYLFVMGELVDVWQNHNICHCDHARMVMRVQYYLMAKPHHHPPGSCNTHTSSLVSRSTYLSHFATACSLSSWSTTNITLNSPFFPGCTRQNHANIYSVFFIVSRRTSTMQTSSNFNPNFEFLSLVLLVIYLQKKKPLKLPPGITTHIFMQRTSTLKPLKSGPVTVIFKKPQLWLWKKLSSFLLLWESMRHQC